MKDSLRPELELQSLVCTEKNTRNTKKEVICIHGNNIDLVQKFKEINKY